MFKEGGQVPLGMCACAPRQAPFASLTFALPNRLSFGAPFASISTHTIDSFGFAQKDPATGIDYPGEFCVLTKKHCPQLAGVG